MYNIKVKGSFSSAHNLIGYKGKCEQLHGHNWEVELVIAKQDLDKIGMVMDFKLVKNKLNALLEKLDHKYLNKTVYFKKVNPTSENIAKFIFEHLKAQIPGIKSVTVWESSNSSATYYAE